MSRDLMILNLIGSMKNRSEDLGTHNSDPNIGIRPVKHVSLRRQITNKKGQPLVVKYSEDPNKIGIFFEYETHPRRDSAGEGSEPGHGQVQPQETASALPPHSPQQGTATTTKKGLLLSVKQCKTGVFSQKETTTTIVTAKTTNYSPQPSPPPSPSTSSKHKLKSADKRQQCDQESEEQHLISKSRFTVNTFFGTFCCARK